MKIDHPEWYKGHKTVSSERMPQKGDTVICIKSWPGRITEGRSYIVKEYDPNSRAYPKSGRLMIEKDDVGSTVNFDYKKFYRLADNTTPDIKIYPDPYFTEKPPIIVPPATISSELLLLLHS